MPPVRHWHRFTDDDCLDALRAADDLGVDVLRLVDYRAWRASQPALRPASGCVVRHLGPWAQAVESAGLRALRPVYGASRRT